MNEPEERETTGELLPTSLFRFPLFLSFSRTRIFSKNLLPACASSLAKVICS